MIHPMDGENHHHLEHTRLVSFCVLAAALPTDACVKGHLISAQTVPFEISSFPGNQNICSYDSLVWGVPGRSLLSLMVSSRAG